MDLDWRALLNHLRIEQVQGQVVPLGSKGERQATLLLVARHPAAHAFDSGWRCLT